MRSLAGGICTLYPLLRGTDISYTICNESISLTSFIDGVDQALDDAYVMPWTRCCVYFMGMLLGYYFYKTGGKFTIPWVRKYGKRCCFYVVSAVLKKFAKLSSRVLLAGVQRYACV